MANKNKNKNKTQKPKVEKQTTPVVLETVAAPEGVLPENEGEVAPSDETAPDAPEAAQEGETETPPVEEEATTEENAGVDAPAEGEPDSTKPEGEEDPVLDDDEEMMEEQDANPAPRAGKEIKAKKLKKFKIRHRAWNRRSPLRVVKPFDFDGESFVVGTVFDWAAAGYKPASVQRLFARGLVRHIVEDGGVVYPFRAIQSPVKKSKKLDPKKGGYDFLPIKDAPKPEAEIQLTDEERLEINRAKHGIGKVAEDDKPKNFSIKGSHKQ